jgi:hypothetical protein
MGNSPDPLANPYAPPAAPIAVPGAATSYTAERRSVLLILVLSIVTLGIYPAFWYLRRARFLDSLSSDQKLGRMPVFLLIAYGVTFVLGAVVGVTREGDALTRPIDLAVGIFGLVIAFRVAHILRSDFARTGRFIKVSGVWVFFLGPLYLQHVINKAADTPPRVV